jgi:hypothetical protein
MCCSDLSNQEGHRQMAAIFVGLRPCDGARLKELAAARGCRPQDLAGIYLERAIRRATAPKEGATTLVESAREAATA